MNPLDQVAHELKLSSAEWQQLQGLMKTAESLAAEVGIPLDDQARLGLATHLVGLVRRLTEGKPLQGIDPAVFTQLPRDCMDIATRLIRPLYEMAGQPVDPAEVGLVALHFGAARERASTSA